MSKKDEALRLSLEALEEIHPGNMTPIAEEAWKKAITAIREALAEQPSTWQQEPQTTHWEGCEAVHPECRKAEHGVKDLSNYEFKTYKMGGTQLEAGFYSTDELRDLVKALDEMNTAAERSMRRMK